ncbi:MAG: MFS transporter [gamma proteobacterium endosymbiont of Lamellibrachia anaximandri]|nr:MFS transporter [gamma proteobacterium endosymbiont of Lamellibrachia anaximandri]MBL3616794.1 MFS transporter [gamma proteobacterium endosymbiont of Lamellibrachia anaximandri]
MRKIRGDALAWVFYDWANSAFATTVMAGFFPLFFKQYWSAGVEATESTFHLGMTNSLASLIIVCLAPLLGSIADQAGAKKGFLLFFTSMGIVMTGALYLVGQGSWMMALTLYGLGILGFSGGVIFYDSLLVSVAEEKDYDRLSALGFGVGYLGGGLLFAFDVVMTLYPGFFGLSGTAEAVRLSFITVAIWWGLFSIPVFLFVKEPQKKHAEGSHLLAGFRQLLSTLRKLRQLRMTFLFLLAYWLYIDGVDTIVRMAVDYGLSIGFDANNLMTALLITQFVGFPAAILFGRLGARRGPRQGIMLAIFIYLMILLWAYRMDSVWEFYALAVAIGLVQGGIQSLSRSLYARLIPRDQAAEFFGFYNMLGKFAVVFGPLLMGWVGVITGDARIAILSVAVLFVAGALLLSRVDVGEGEAAARSFAAG